MATSLALIPLLLRHGKELHPNVRRLECHHAPTAKVERLGGAALIAAFVLVALFTACLIPLSDLDRHTLLALSLGSLGIFALGFCDDLQPLDARFKFVVQALIATAVYFGGIRIEFLKDPFTHADVALGMTGFFVTVGWLVFLTNLINLIDGIDGLAAGICLMLMCLLINLGIGGAGAYSVLVPVGVAGGLIGFLRFNYPPAKIHMGDGGAYFLGFLIGALSIVNSNKGTVAAALIAPAFALALPIADAGLTLFRRGVGGLPVFRPDRKHIHHHLITLGFSLERTVLALYAVSFLCLSLAFGLFWMQGRYLPLFCGLLFLVLLAAGHITGLSRNWLAIVLRIGVSLALRKQARYALILSQWLELEVQRHHRIDRLWEDYVFFLQRLGFSSAHVTSPEASFFWRADNQSVPPGDAHQTTFTTPTGSAIEFTADRNAIPLQLFHLLTELAGETWHKTASACQVLRPETALPPVRLRSYPASSVPITNPLER